MRRALRWMRLALEAGRELPQIVHRYQKWDEAADLLVIRCAKGALEETEPTRCRLWSKQHLGDISDIKHVEQGWVVGVPGTELAPEMEKTRFAVHATLYYYRSIDSVCPPPCRYQTWHLTSHHCAPVRSSGHPAQTKSI